VAIKESKDLKKMKVKELKNSPEAREQGLFERSTKSVLVQNL